MSNNSLDTKQTPQAKSSKWPIVLAILVALAVVAAAIVVNLPNDINGTYKSVDVATVSGADDQAVEQAIELASDGNYARNVPAYLVRVIGTTLTVEETWEAELSPQLLGEGWDLLVDGAVAGQAVQRDDYLVISFELDNETTAIGFKRM